MKFGFWGFMTIVFFTAVGGIAYVWYLAVHGSVTAQVVMVTLGVGFIFALVEGKHLLTDWIRDRAEQKRFNANMQENFALLESGFKTQNQGMNSAIKHARLLQRGGPPRQDDIEMDDSMFDVIPE